MIAISPPLVERAVVGLVLIVASITDVRRRQVPLWLSLGFIAIGVVLGAFRGLDGFWSSLIGLTVGTLPVVPFVLLGGFGGADLLLLGAVGAWEGWHFVLLAESWTALVGAALAIAARYRHQAATPYVPAILVGTALAFIVV
jgi:Flp pilus assembly protein protease CpaA